MREIYLMGLISLSFAASVGCGNLPPFPASEIKEVVFETCSAPIQRGPNDFVMQCQVKTASYPIVKQNPLTFGDGQDWYPVGSVFGFTHRETPAIIDWIKTMQSSRRKR